MVVPSLTEKDMSQNSNSTSYISFVGVGDNLQHPCQPPCDQERSVEYHSNCTSYHSASEILFQGEDAPMKSENTLFPQQFLQGHEVFYEECHQHVSKYVSGGFEENIIPPIYDEQEGDL